MRWMANESFWSLLSCSGFSAKCIDFFYLLKTFLPLNSDKYFALFWCFVLGFPLSFYWLSGVKWIRMWSHRPWLRLLTKPTTILSWSIMLALITLLTYPVSTCTAERSFCGMKMLQTPLRRTITDEGVSSLAILHIHKHKDVQWNLY